MPKSDKELAVELAIAQINNAAITKPEDYKSGALPSSTICDMIELFYTKLSSLESNAE